MGLEARCSCRWGDEAGEVKALLESRELILRGDLRRTIPIGAISDVRIDGDILFVKAGADQIALDLGAATAAKWAKKIETPPPSLAQKLGLGPVRAMVIGDIADTALLEALAGHRAGQPGEAGLSLAVVEDADGLEWARLAHEAAQVPGPIWIAYRKGPRVAFGDNQVRAHMRAAGYADNKVSAVSDILSATRYAARKANAGV